MLRYKEISCKERREREKKREREKRKRERNRERELKKIEFILMYFV